MGRVGGEGEGGPSSPARESVLEGWRRRQRSCLPLCLCVFVRDTRNPRNRRRSSLSSTDDAGSRVAALGNLAQSHKGTKAPHPGSLPIQDECCAAHLLLIP